jgi:hypothetical protein
MKLTVEVLGGRYLGDVCASATYAKGAVRQTPGILEACDELGRRSVEEMRARGTEGSLEGTA